MFIEVYCPRCGGVPIIRMHRVRRYRWLERLPHWRGWDCGSLKCAWLNYLGQFVGWHTILKTREIVN